MNAASINIAKPRRFSTPVVLAIYAGSFLLALPILVALLVVSLQPLGFLALLLLLFAFALTIFLLPLIGNECVKWIVRDLPPAATPSRDSFLVQITFCPRIRSGFRALIDDADDLGYLTLAPDGLVFEGDSVKLKVPYGQVRAVESQNAGFRGMFVFRRRISLGISGLPNVELIEVAERSSRLLSTSKTVTNGLYRQISANLNQPSSPSS